MHSALLGGSRWEYYELGNDLREVAILMLFALFSCGALLQVGYMLVCKRRRKDVSGHRLIFFFMASLSLICVLPLWLFGRLNPSIWMGDLSVVLINLIGWGLTFGWNREGEGRLQEENQRVRAYTVYYRGQPFGVVTKEGFGRLAELNLLRKQQTVELIDHYAEEARRQGFRVVLLQNNERNQTLIKVEEI